MNTSFSDFYNNQLNPQQQKAVAHTDGPLLVIAGAGSGKTRVITARIVNLIVNHQVPPSAIVALTFTNKAALEMKERIISFLGNSHHIPFIGTFHAYCLRLLKMHYARTGKNNFTILDEDDQRELLSKIIKRNHAEKRITAKAVSYQISHIKNKMGDAQQAANNYLFFEIYKAYEQEKKASNCLDFDDLLVEACALFEDATFKQQYQQTIQHILVDEYQDTNLVQHELLQHITKHDGELAIKSVCIVGDEDQSIYAWRGATVTNIMHFPQDFADTTMISIEQNYRSVQPILTLANTVIANNTQRNPKNIWSTRDGSNRIQLLSCLSEYQESEVITQCIQANNSGSTAILYRTHAQSRAIEEALVKHAIPYTIVGGIRFYERKEIKDLLAYLRLHVNPFDRIAFSRAFNCPPRGLGAKFEDLFQERWSLEPFLSCIDITHRLIAENAVTGIKKTALLSFIEIITPDSNTASPSAVLEKVITKTNYLQHIHDSYEGPEVQERSQNVKELVHALAYAEQNGTETLGQFLDDVALMQDKQAKNADGHKVVLMTLHAAKGLEFDTVIISGLEEGLLPSSRSLYDRDALEEERRLLYVGITRAQERLLLTHCRYRYLYGSMTDQVASRFLEEMPQELAPRTSCSFWNTTHMQQFFRAWLHNKTTSAAQAERTSTVPKAAAVSAPTIATSTITKSGSASFKKNQPVKHETFGMGVVTAVEQRNGQEFLEIKFKAGTKKIASRFVQKM